MTAQEAFEIASKFEKLSLPEIYDRIRWAAEAGYYMWLTSTGISLHQHEILSHDGFEIVIKECNESVYTIIRW